MTADPGTAGSQSAPTAQSPHAAGRVPAQSILGERYAVGELVRWTHTAEVYAATDLQSDSPVHVHVVYDALAATPQLREVVMSAARAAMAAPHPNLATPVDVRFDGQYCMVVTAPQQGTTLRELLARRAESGSAGLGPRGVINVLDAVCDALAVLHQRDVAHGWISADTVYIDSDGIVTVADLAMGALMAAAVQAEVSGLEAPPELAPEVSISGLPSAEGDVFGLGMLLYELLVGRRLQKGGPRPSQQVPGLSPSIDQLIGRAVSPEADHRPPLAEFRTALRGGVAAPQPAQQAPQPAGPSLAQSLAPQAASLNVDPALLADTEERWLISKGRLDYGPFSSAELVEQIRTDEVVPGNVIVDNFSGERCDIEEHPVFGPLVEQAKQIRDDRRRANAEVVHAKQEKRRGAVLYLVIAAGVLALAGLTYVIVTKTSKEDKQAAQGINAVGAGEFTAKISFPKTPKKRSKRKRPSRSSGAGSDEDVLALDMSDNSGTERLDNATINSVIQRHGGRLGGCLAKNGGGYAKINFIIDGPTGRVKSVKVNGQKSGGLYACLNRVMRSIEFPSVDGPRTRAEFDMEL